MPQNPDPRTKRLAELKARLGPNYNYQALANLYRTNAISALPKEMQELGRDLVVGQLGEQSVSNPPGPFKRGMTMLLQATAANLAGPLMGKEAAKEGITTSLKMLQQFGHDLSVGAIPGPDVEDQEAWDTVIKPATTISAMVTQGYAAAGALGYFSKIPAAAMKLEQIPQRLRDIGAGATVLGIPDALRPEGVSEDPSNLDPAAVIAQKLEGIGVPGRLGLGIGGAVVGGALGYTFMGIARGVNAARTGYVASQMTPETIEVMKQGLVSIGVDVSQATNKYKTAELFVKNFRKIALDEKLAGVVSDRLAREEYIMTEMLGHAVAPGSEEHRLIAGLFRVNPGGVTIVKDVTNTQAIDDITTKLGVKLQAQRIKRGETIEHLEPPKASLAPEATRVAIFDADFHEVRTNIEMEAAGGHHTLAISDEAAKVEKTSGALAYVDQDGGVTVMVSKDSRLTDYGIRVGLTKAGLPYQGATVIRQVVRPPRNYRVRHARAPEDKVYQLPGAEKFTPKYDLLISRPDFEYPIYAQVSKATKRTTEVLKKLAKAKATKILEKPTAEALILADGEPVRGGILLKELGKMKVPEPVIGGQPRPDIGLRQMGNFVRTEVKGNNLTIDLPPTITKEQFNSIGQAVNAMKFDEVAINPFSGAGKTLKTPFGQQVQDVIADMVKPVKVSSPITPAMVQQYKAQGVFDGQAGILADGSPVRVVGKAGFLTKVIDPLTGDTRLVHPSKITTLPTTLEGEFAPSKLFLEALTGEEKIAFATVRRGLSQGLGVPIKSFRQLESFAASRGFWAVAQKGGKIELQSSLSGETQAFKDTKAAIEFIRKSSGPMPELTPDDLRRHLGGDVNLGNIGGSAPPPNFGEMVPLPTDKWLASFDKLETNRGASMLEQWLQPTRRLMQELDRRFGTQFWSTFDNLQSQYVGKQNFETLWYTGAGGKLPEGVLPLRKIRAMAGGNKANEELITDWLETAKGTPEANALLKQMTAGEQAAAKELRKWYDSVFDNFGIERDYLENYAPRWRTMGGKYGNNPFNMWKALGGDPLNPPGGVKFFADNARYNIVDIYEKRAFVSAGQYLAQGASNRFMKKALDEGAEIVRQVAARNERLAFPLAHMLDALRGREFLEQRAMMSETVQRILEKLPGRVEAGVLKDTSDRWVNLLMGTVYSATMGFRFGLALRNTSSILTMLYPVFGGNKQLFIQAIGKTMTKVGRDEAVAARAISLKQGAVFAQEDIYESLPRSLVEIAESSMYLYDTADQITRSVAYHLGKSKAQQALSDFAGRVKTGKAGKEELRRSLIVESGLHIHEKAIGDEFLRRALGSPDSAAEFAGKQLSDVVNFLYGRGMQARWMRSVPGRLFGQFGTWSLWYIDYLTRMPRVMIRNGYKKEAAAFLARHALVNGAMLAGGLEVLDVDLGRWLAYPSVFYSGGPALEVVRGASTLMRGLGAQAAGGEDPLGGARVSEGLGIIENTLPAFVPFFYAGRDVVRFTEGVTGQLSGTEALAAFLSTKPTRDYTWQQKLEIILGGESKAFQSDSPVLEDILNSRAGSPSPQPVVNWQTYPLEVGTSPQQLGAAMSRPLGSLPPPNTTSRSPSPVPSLGGPLAVPQLPRTTFPGEATRPSEAPPPRQF